MSNNLRIARNEFIRAQSIRHSVGPAAQAIAAIDAGVLGLSTKDANTVADAAAILNKISGDAQAVIDQGNKQFVERDVELINRASSRFFAIDADIELAKAIQLHTQNAHDVKTDELKKMSFAQEEIDAVLTDPAPEIAALEQKIAGLRAEKLRISDFLNDSPRYNTDLLKYTSIEVGNSETAQAA